jgi:hypothetical protein
LAANDGNVPAFTLTSAQLEAVVLRGVSRALAEQGPAEPAPRLLDRVALARALGCSPGMVDKCRREGMPCVRVGDSPRFEYEDCIAWLRQGHGEQAAAL